MPLAPGQPLSFYEILGPIGAGGMGAVYCARDTRLDRDVAIKVLPDCLADDETRLRRFEREAKTLARLNHPNIAGIHGLHQEDGITFLALELVQGVDLAERLARGALPVREALDVCRQIAEGLEAAHEAGVVHRDLKPANVRITPEGVVKILDFGLAKLARPAAAAEASRADPGSVQITEEGLVMGTPAYMSPEQTCGKPVDRRMDVWAFGCVLYECLAGVRAHDGGSVGEILASVLERDWDRGALPGTTPAHVRELLERCLDKDPRRRLRDIGEARIALERPIAEPALEPSVRPRGVLLLAGFAVALALGVGAGKLLTAEGATVPPLRAKRLTERSGMEEMPTVSPDGQKLAFVARVEGRRQVFLRLMAQGGSPKPITAGEREHSFPRWVDESTLIYFAHPENEGGTGSLWETLILGSTPPKLLGPAQGEVDPSRFRGRLATFRTNDESGDGPVLVLSDRDGRNAKTLPLPAAMYSYSSPRWSPDGRHVAFEARMDLSRTEIRVLEVATGDMRALASASAMRGLAWLPDGSGLVYASSQGSTLPYPPVFRLRTVRLADGLDTLLPLADAGYASYVEPDVSTAGSLVASRVHVESDIYRYPVDGTPLENVRRAERITRQTGLVQVPTVSPTGEEVAYLSDSGGHANVWISRVDGTGDPRPITHETDPEVLIGIPHWSPRGDWIVYWRGIAGSHEEWLVRPDGTQAHLLIDGIRGGASWSGDGRWVYYHSGDVQAASAFKTDVETRETVLVRHDACAPAVTQDGRTIYFSRNEETLGEIWRASPVETGTPERLGPSVQSRLPLWPHQFALAPDGLGLAIALMDRGTTNLWILSTEDGSLRQVTDYGERATLIARQVSWSPDSKSIFAALMEMDADVVLLEGALP